MTSAPLRDRVAVVTGAARGLGLAIAEALAAQGARVVLADIDAAEAGLMAERLGDADRAMSVALDIRDPAALQAVLDKVNARFGSVDILVNNAAVTHLSNVWDITPEEFADVVRVNLGGTFAAMQIFGSHMRDRGCGRILNIGSIAGQTGGSGTGAHYAASKAGIGVLTKVFARELAPYGVTVNCVAPGPLDGPIARAAPEAVVKRILGTIPVGRLGTSEEIANIVCFLCGPDAGFVTGTTWDANGGQSMR